MYWCPYVVKLSTYVQIWQIKHLQYSITNIYFLVVHDIAIFKILFAFLKDHADYNDYTADSDDDNDYTADSDDDNDSIIPIVFGVFFGCCSFCCITIICAIVIIITAKKNKRSARQLQQISRVSTARPPQADVRLPQVGVVRPSQVSRSRPLQASVVRHHMYPVVGHDTYSPNSTRLSYHNTQQQNAQASTVRESTFTSLVPTPPAYNPFYHNTEGTAIRSTNNLSTQSNNNPPQSFTVSSDTNTNSSHDQQPPPYNLYFRNTEDAPVGPHINQVISHDDTPSDPPPDYATVVSTTT